MNLITEFVEQVIPTVGEHCQHPGTVDCLEWSDHICADDTARCQRHCTCPPAAERKPRAVTDPTPPQPTVPADPDQTRSMRINGGLRTDVLSIELPDGRRIIIYPSGRVIVRKGIEQYTLNLPTVDEVDRLCGQEGNTHNQDGEVWITIHHRH